MKTSRRHLGPSGSNIFSKSLEHSTLLFLALLHQEMGYPSCHNFPEAKITVPNTFSCVNRNVTSFLCFTNSYTRIFFSTFLHKKQFACSCRNWTSWKLVTVSSSKLTFPAVNPPIHLQTVWYETELAPYIYLSNQHGFSRNHHSQSFIHLNT